MTTEKTTSDLGVARPTGPVERDRRLIEVREGGREGREGGREEEKITGGLGVGRMGLVGRGRRRTEVRREGGREGGRESCVLPGHCVSFPLSLCPVFALLTPRGFV